MIKLVKNEFFIYCKETRIESNRSFYGSFSLGPFDSGQSITIANALRRTLLSELKGLAITSAEIEGAFHEYSTLPGVKDSILDILLNLKDIVLKSVNYGNKKKGTSYGATFKNKQIGYLKTRGPGIVTALELKLPPGIQCVDPDQYIATLSEEGILNMKIHINEGKNYVIQSSYSPPVIVPITEPLQGQNESPISSKKKTFSNSNQKGSKIHPLKKDSLPPVERGTQTTVPAFQNEVPNAVPNEPIRPYLREISALSNWNRLAPQKERSLISKVKSVTKALPHLPLSFSSPLKEKQKTSPKGPKKSLFFPLPFGEREGVSNLAFPFGSLLSSKKRAISSSFGHFVPFSLFSLKEKRAKEDSEFQNVRQGVALQNEFNYGVIRSSLFFSPSEISPLPSFGNRGLGIFLNSDQLWKEPLRILNNFMGKVGPFYTPRNKPLALSSPSLSFFTLNKKRELKKQKEGAIVGTITEEAKDKTRVRQLRSTARFLEDKSFENSGESQSPLRVQKRMQDNIGPFSNLPSVFLSSYNIRKRRFWLHRIQIFKIPFLFQLFGSVKKLKNQSGANRSISGQYFEREKTKEQMGKQPLGNKLRRKQEALEREDELNNKKTNAIGFQSPQEKPQDSNRIFPVLKPTRKATRVWAPLLADEGVSFSPLREREGGLITSKAFPLAIDAVFMPVNKVNYIIEINEQSVMSPQISTTSSSSKEEPFLISPWGLNLTPQLSNSELTKSLNFPFLTLSPHLDFSPVSLKEKKGEMTLPKRGKKGRTLSWSLWTKTQELSLPFLKKKSKSARFIPFWGLFCFCRFTFPPPPLTFFPPSLKYGGKNGYGGGNGCGEKRGKGKKERAIRKQSFHLSNRTHWNRQAQVKKLPGGKKTNRVEQYSLPFSALPLRKEEATKQRKDESKAKTGLETGNETLLIALPLKKSNRINTPKTLGFFFKTAAAQNIISAQFNLETDPSFLVQAFSRYNKKLLFPFSHKKKIENGAVRSISSEVASNQKSKVSIFWPLEHSLPLKPFRNTGNSIKPRKEGESNAFFSLPRKSNREDKENRDTNVSSKLESQTIGQDRSRYTKRINMKLSNPQTKIALRNNIILEIWTNGSIHPRQALYEACKNLLSLFSKLEKATPLAFPPFAPPTL